jgi:hypothetical protein
LSICSVSLSTLTSRIGDQPERERADGELRGVLAARLMQQVRVKVVEALPADARASEFAQLLAEHAFVLPEQAVHRLIGVNDLPIGIRHHHTTRHVIQGCANAAVLDPLMALFGDLRRQTPLHGSHAREELADLIATGLIDAAIVLALGDALRDVQQAHDGAGHALREREH